jgi:hypothetical protein
MSVKTVDVNINATGMGTIIIDGKPVTHVRGVRISTQAGQLTRVELEVVPMYGVHFSGDAEVDIKHVCPACKQKLPEDEQAREFGKDL